MKDLKDDEVIALYHKEAYNLSYYNAAEGVAYSKEASARHECRMLFNTIRYELERRGITKPTGNYLI